MKNTVDIIVRHSAFELKDKMVASVEAPYNGNIEDSLEYAYVATQNVFGSWSMGEYLDGIKNEDYNPNIILLEELEEYQGKPCGFRSTSVGDFMYVKNPSTGNLETWKVMGCGFNQID